ncbi:metallophosphoesterase [Bacillus sp. JJ634]
MNNFSYRKIGRKSWLILLLFCLVLVAYIIWDNHRIIIVEQDVVINNLSKDLEGFSILQITDLHEKEFGENQRGLLEKINSIDYDAIIFTGDMLDDSTSTNYKPYYTLIEGIDNKEYAFFVPGNTDPEKYRLDSAHSSYEKHDFIKGMEQRGVQLLESVEPLQIEDSTIYFVDFEMSILNSQYELSTMNYHKDSKAELDSNYYAHQKQLLNELAILNQAEDSEVLIALNHYPVVDPRVDQLTSDERYLFRNYDLIIAGHYHGGQIRVPLLGAVFVPEEWYENGGFFPPTDRVKGLWEYNRTKQYVSTGLGSSDAIPFMKFRFLNPPEINVLTLTRGK